jgi:glycosyltransferase involved in cell wall biosynthesis
VGARVNILQISTADRGGGAEAVALSLHRALRARGHDAWLAVGVRRTDEPGVLAIGRGAAPGHPRLARLARALRDPGVLSDLALGHEDFRFPASRRVLDLPPRPPDIVHVHNLHGGYFDLRVLSELGRRARLVATLHDAWLFTGHCAHPFDSDGWLRGCGDCPHLRTYPALLRDGTAFNLARKRSIYADVELTVVTPSRWLMDMVERSVLAPAAVRREVIPYGVDLEVFAPGDREQARQELGVAGGVPLVVFSAQGGRANEFKDFPTLREALGRIGVPVQAVALGDPVPGEEQVGRATVRAVGAVPPGEVARWLRAADVYVHASRADTFPNGVLEALACGTAVVASRVGGIPEQVGEETGVLVQPGDPVALAAALESLLGDPVLRGRMAAAGATDARERFSPDRQVDAYLELYADLD